MVWPFSGDVDGGKGQFSAGNAVGRLILRPATRDVPDVAGMPASFNDPYKPIVPPGAQTKVRRRERSAQSVVDLGG